MKQGDFSTLADDYSKYRPGYSETVLRALLRLLPRPSLECDAVDVGAGTGIWSRMLAPHFRTTTAVEPNDAMRGQGETGGGNIKWQKGSGEETGVPSASADFVSMASSFHWTKFEKSTAEFHRLLRADGLFVALWNPRLVEANPLLLEIESHLKVLCPTLKRVSSGRSGITETLSEQLTASPYFKDVIYLEGRHVVEQSLDHYIGAWRSVNDVQAQLGSAKFEEFLKFAADKIGKGSVRTTYLTRAWCAVRR